MLRWEWIALAYFSYLALVAALFPRFVRARRYAFTAGVAAWVMLPLVVARGGTWSAELIRALVPAPFLLVGYWVSGAFFVRPMPRIERLLRHVDDLSIRWIGAAAWPNAAKRWLGRYLELAYFLVYLVVPGGAVWLVAAGRADAVDRFWACVLLAAFASYGMLPWVQTRPPRAVDEFERHPQAEPDWLRRLNLWVLGRASIQANTMPSGHAATATAVALAVGTAIPHARPILFVISASIVAATIVGRYHYVLDSVAGVVVGLCAWMLVVVLD